MLRLSFGLTCSPFLATRCLHQLADDYKSSHQSIHRILKEDFLVDNLLTEKLFMYNNKSLKYWGKLNSTYKNGLLTPKKLSWLSQNRTERKSSFMKFLKATLKTPTLLVSTGILQKKFQSQDKGTSHQGLYDKA